MNTCPNCGRDGMEIVYAIDGIPVHSTINLASRDEALSFPTGDLRLGYCRACGFLSNTVYDLSVQDYSSNCEESQHVSPTFNKFAGALAARWIERYDLRNKTILEIGCGRGEFLALMCELGNNRGIGIDPHSQPTQSPGGAAARIEFIRDLYSEKYAHLEADCILCRHTLEHIGPTREFVRMIRRAIGTRNNMLVLFELPDVTRILREAAFWDVYYEHCSYFSSGSLARLFRASHFDLLELGRDYGDQYLLLAAKPADLATQPAFPLENDIQQMNGDVEHFRRAVPSTIEHWRSVILSARRQGKKVVLWSALSKAVSFLTTLKVGDAIEYTVDINPHRQGRYLPTTAQPIVAPSFLQQYKPDLVILMNPIYVAEVQRDLARMGLSAEVLPVGHS
jgi:SAM-dependent methyltransferase